MSITRNLLASDLDGTLIPLERTPERLAEVRTLVDALERADGLQLAYVTGRHLALARSGIAEVGLPEPDWFVCDVGTSVYRRIDGGYEADETYRRAMRQALGGISAPDVQRALGSVEGIWLQEDEKQGEFKVSYYTEGRHERYLGRVQAGLDSAGARVALVASYDPVSERGLLDILPAAVAKDYAVRYLQKRTGVAEDGWVYAGDSGNDRAAMLAGYKAIVVGNADDALKRDLAELAATEGLATRLYFALRPYAAGVHEGLVHFGLF
mgnify:FL=1